MSSDPAQQHSLQCMEVWGGNQLADTGVVMAGLDAWVYCRPFAGDDAGGDVYYVSSCATGRITRLLVADVSGHGSIVASIATSLRSLMRQHVNQIDQTRFVQSMNQQFAAMSKAGCFATAIVTTFFAPTHEFLTDTFEAIGDYQQAIAEREKAATLYGRETTEVATRRTAALREAVAKGQARGYWEKQLEFAQEDAPRSEVDPCGLASIYANLGDRDNALNISTRLSRSGTKDFFTLMNRRPGMSFVLMRSFKRLCGALV